MSSPESAIPTLLICRVCRCVRDDQEVLTSGWLTKEAYRMATGIHPITCRLRHTYCPPCRDFMHNHKRAA